MYGIEIKISRNFLKIPRKLDIILVSKEAVGSSGPKWSNSKRSIVN